MKNGYKVLILSALLAFTACSSDFLSREPLGSTLTQAQFEKLANALEGSMRGIYSMMYTVSDHDQFGKRSIDMYTDLMAGDMALTNYTYGWFYTDELGQGNTARAGYLWSYYYGILHNVNTVIYAAQGGDEPDDNNIIRRVSLKGLPNNYDAKTANYYTIQDGDTLAVFTEIESRVANYYAQALTMRGYLYSNLLMQFCDANVSDLSQLCFPLYNENNMALTQPLATMQSVYDMVESDLTNAIDYFEAFAEGNTRSSKLEVDASVAAGILAYSYLNKANPRGNNHSDAYTEAYNNAVKYAEMAIAKSGCSVLPNSELCKTGFNDVNINCWMWGQKVTTETAGGLASWFGQVDIHSYSYAWAGDTKAIDENLYKLIPDYDGRKLWFNDGKANSTYKLCPDGKFFSNRNQFSTKADDIDREWLSDNVFMRVESMYLIAAEAYYRLGKESEAKAALTTITDQRVMTGMESDYSAHVSSLNMSNLLAEIEYNWRVELWGEGYALQTLRRLGPETIQEGGANQRKRGGNHCGNAGAAISATSSTLTFPMPSSEISYNPNIKGTELD